MVISNKQRAELRFAESLGFIPAAGERSTEEILKDLLKDLMDKKNSGLNAESFGKTSFNEISFVRYLIAKFRMDFVFEKTNYAYREITEEDIENYYEEHKIEFLRENKEYFPLEEMREVINKRIRELEYEGAVSDLLY